MRPVKARGGLIAGGGKLLYLRIQVLSSRNRGTRSSEACIISLRILPAHVRSNNPYGGARGGRALVLLLLLIC